ncbi:MAG: hypothetical protein GY696_37790, partial [Gammaproteobacteria bacterium]|nr:hypothetical protein [Gammaproteobacteria bacterium]
FECDGANRDNAEQLCQPMIDRDGPFKGCRDALGEAAFDELVAEFYENCIFDLCSIGEPELACKQMDALAQVCQVSMDAAAPIQWRTTDFCRKSPIFAIELFLGAPNTRGLKCDMFSLCLKLKS